MQLHITGLGDDINCEGEFDEETGVYTVDAATIGTGRSIGDITVNGEPISSITFDLGAGVVRFTKAP